MPLSAADLERLQAEEFADDVAIDVGRMGSWTEAQARSYFASGGTALPPPPKLRLLALHAFRSNAKILERQMGMARQVEKLDDLCEFVFLDAPYVCSAEEEGKAYDIVKKVFPTHKFGAYREWYNATEVPSVGEASWPHEFATYDRFEPAIGHVVDALCAASPPFDGLVGFSQGGSLVAQLVALQHAGRLPAACPPIRFAWIQSSRRPRDPSCKGLFEPPIPRVPCLVHYNEDDTSVLPEETRRLGACLAQATLVVSPRGGHSCVSLLSQPEAAAAVRRFFEARHAEGCGGAAGGEE